MGDIGKVSYKYVRIEKMKPVYYNMISQPTNPEVDCIFIEKNRFHWGTTPKESNSCQIILGYKHVNPSDSVLRYKIISVFNI